MRKAVSSMIAYVLIALVSTTALIITLTALAPAFDNAKSTSTLSDAFQNLNTLDSAIRTIASESHGSKRTVPLSVSDGTYGINATNDWLYFEYTPNENLALGGTKGNVHVEQGSDFADYFNSYTSGSTASPAWTNTSGQWEVSDSSYLGQNGLAYINISTLENWKFGVTITNVSGVTGGQVFVLPTTPESLVGYWTMDESSDGTTYDYSGNRNNGTLTNMNTTGNATSGWQASCKYGGCLRFDGVNDYVDSGNSTSLNFGTNNFTIAVWAKADGGITGRGILNKGGWGSIGYGIQEAYSPANRYYFVVRDSTGYKPVALPLYATWGWTHIVCIKTTNHLEVWINGSYNTEYNGAIGSLSNPTKNFEIGRSSDPYYFNGTVDEVMVFNRALTPGEIASLYETGVKKLSVSGTQSVAAKTNASIVLSNPAGATKFDDVTITAGGNDITMIVPYDGIDINGTLRVGKGQHQVEILNMGVNATSNKQMVQIRAA
jgi:hypothetical protein